RPAASSRLGADMALEESGNSLLIFTLPKGKWRPLAEMFTYQIEFRRSVCVKRASVVVVLLALLLVAAPGAMAKSTVTVNPLGFLVGALDRKSTRLNSSHVKISYAVFCL